MKHLKDIKFNINSVTTSSVNGELLYILPEKFMYNPLQIRYFHRFNDKIEKQ